MSAVSRNKGLVSTNSYAKWVICGKHDRARKTSTPIQCLPQDEYIAKVQLLYPDNATAKDVLKLYPVDSFPQPRDAMVLPPTSCKVPS